MFSKQYSINSNAKGNILQIRLLFFGMCILDNSLYLMKWQEYISLHLHKYLVLNHNENLSYRPLATNLTSKTFNVM